MEKLYEWYSLAVIYPDESWEYIYGENGNCHFNTFEEANNERIYLQPDYDNMISVLKETRQVIE
jgi:hypothetical protein